MASGWRPTAGQVALIEDGQGDDVRVTGVVLGTADGPIVVHLGGGRPALVAGDVVASFVGHDALYRVRATMSLHDGTDDLVDLVAHSVERVQRRTASRVGLNVPVVLSNFDDPAAGTAAFASVRGESVDLGEGGCRVRVPRAFPAGCDPTLSLELPAGATVVALAAVSQVMELAEGYEYRLVFLEMDDADRAVLRDVIGGLATA